MMRLFEGPAPIQGSASGSSKSRFCSLGSPLCHRRSQFWQPKNWNGRFISFSCGTKISLSASIMQDCCCDMNSSQSGSSLHLTVATEMIDTVLPGSFRRLRLRNKWHLLQLWQRLQIYSALPGAKWKYDKIVSMERDLKIHSIALSSLFVLPYFSLPRCRTRQLGIRVN